MSRLARTHRDLDVYQKAFDAAMQIFEISPLVSTRKNLRTHRPDSTLVQGRLCQSCRGLAQTTLQETFHQQDFRL